MAPGSGLFRATVSRPSASLAVRALQHEWEPRRAWIMFQCVLHAGVAVDVRFFTSMMQVCKRCLPAKAPDVMAAAADRRVRITDVLFCTFLGACQAARPVLAREAVEHYAKSGPRSHNVIFGVANICRLSKNPASALFLVSDAIDNGVEMSDKLLSMFAACCAEARSPLAADVAERILALVRSASIAAPHNQTIFGNLFKALLSQNRVDAALQALPVMDAVGLPPSDRIRTHILSALCRASRIADALDVFRAMVDRGIPVDLPVFTLFVRACGRCTELAALHTLHRYAIDEGLALDDAVVSALVAAYNDCGCLPAAEDAFTARLAGSPPPDAFAFNSMISAYSHHGMLPQATTTFECMKACGVRPTGHTLSSLLSACGHAGDLRRANAIAAEFTSTWSVAAADEHLNCMIGLHGRVGNLDEAERMAAAAPGANVVSWMAVLSACRRHNDLPRAERAFANVLALPGSSSYAAAAYVLMSNVYAAAGRFDDVDRLRDRMRAQGLSKVPGRTSLLLPDRSVVHFYANDAKVHADPELRRRHARLMEDLERDGYAPDVSVATRRGASDDDLRRVVFAHSEKIAIAYALHVLPPDEPIRLTKTLRACTDCHESTRRVSALFHRDVHVRDGNRHHHFHAGRCSCGDYW